MNDTPAQSDPAGVVDVTDVPDDCLSHARMYLMRGPQTYEHWVVGTAARVVSLREQMNYTLRVFELPS